MTEANQFKQTRPFIAWSCSFFYNVPTADFQISCEKHLRKTYDLISSEVGKSNLEGIIVYDEIQRGLAVASLLAQQNRTLPESCNGATCDSHFDEKELCDATNAHSIQARLNEGARGMLVRGGQDNARQFILLDQRQVSYLHPIGRKENPNLSLAAFGLLAHELGHAHDYSNNRPGLASRDETAKAIGTDNADAIHTIADMALAEYVATRSECHAQVKFHGACSENLTNRISMMASRDFSIPQLEQPQTHDPNAAEQHRMNLSSAGYFIGTLAAYKNARAEIIGDEGHHKPDRTDQLLAKNLPAGSPLAGLIDQTEAALERAASKPDAASRRALVSTIHQAIECARNAPRKETRKTQDASIDDWFDEI